MDKEYTYEEVRICDLANKIKNTTNLYEIKLKQNPTSPSAWWPLMKEMQIVRSLSNAVVELRVTPCKILVGFTEQEMEDFIQTSSYSGSFPIIKVSEKFKEALKE